MTLRLVLISDTHNQHDKITVPDGDVLIHAGDFGMRGTENETRSFLAWYKRQMHRHKLFIAGNHDWLYERNGILARSLVPQGVIYLEDSGCEIEGLNFYGSPVQPRFGNWAFNRDKDIKRHWDAIPDNTDVLITHGPPKGILDEVWAGNVGCPYLRDRVLTLKPKLHVFGHIHEGRGEKHFNDTHFVNAGVVDEYYYMDTQPAVVDL